jgi:LacI family transcriptional regulator
VRVPEDISLAGFDDIPLVRELSPPLTTVALPLTAMGEEVMALALREPRGPRSRGLRVGGEVVLRASVAPPPTPPTAPVALPVGGAQQLTASPLNTGCTDRHLGAPER